MDNIEIKRTTNKRNMESLLQQSAIDNNSFNYQAQQVRQAYTKTIKDMNQKIKQHERTIQKLQLQLNQKNQVIDEQFQFMKQKQEYTNSLLSENNDLKQSKILLKKRMQQAEYKLQKIQANRQSIPKLDESLQEEDMKNQNIKLSQSIKKQTYNEIKAILTTKIEKFVKQIKLFPMSVQLEHFVESFLQDIIYINSNEKKKDIFNQKQHIQTKNRRAGRISQRRNNNMNDKISDLDEWKKMEKSLQKLKSAGTVSPNTNRLPENRQSTKNQKQQWKKPVINYI